MEMAPGWGQAGASKVCKVSRSAWVGCSPWDLGSRLPAECLEAEEHELSSRDLGQLAFTFI